MRPRGGPFQWTGFSIAHRGAALRFPECTRESYEAGARQGAGIVECDVTFTREGQLVCRHAENDLHTTTDILRTPLAAACVGPFTPASVDPSGRPVAASAGGRASALAPQGFKSLRGEMDAFSPPRAGLRSSSAVPPAGAPTSNPLAAG